MPVMCDCDESVVVEVSARHTVDRTRHIHNAHKTQYVLCAHVEHKQRARPVAMVSVFEQSARVAHRQLRWICVCNLRPNTMHFKPHAFIAEQQHQIVSVVIPQESSSVYGFASNATRVNTFRTAVGCAESSPVRSESACRPLWPPAISTSSSLRAHRSFT